MNDDDDDDDEHWLSGNDSSMHSGCRNTSPRKLRQPYNIVFLRMHGMFAAPLMHTIHTSVVFLPKYIYFFPDIAKDGAIITFSRLTPQLSRS